MEIEMEKYDEYVFLRERATRLYAEGLSQEAKALLNTLDEEQAKRFAQCSTMRVCVAK